MLKKSLPVNKFLFVTLSCILLIMFTSGCADKKVSSSISDSITFTDSLNRDIVVQKNPERVAALIGSFADVWMLSGGNICASCDDAWDDFKLDMKDAVNIGKTKEPNLEKLLESNPDFVIASSSTAANIEMKDTLEAMGITVAYFDVESFDDYLKMLDICTSITGRKDLYKKNGLDIKTQIDAIKEDFRKTNIPNDKKTVLFLRASSGYIRAKNSRGTILGEMLKELGCVNIADNDTSLLENLSIESIIEKNPYHIFIVQVGDNEQAVKNNISKMMKENPVWNELDAVKNSRIHYMDKNLFNLKPNARWNEAYEELCNILRK